MKEVIIKELIIDIDEWKEMLAKHIFGKNWKKKKAKVDKQLADKRIK